MNKFSDEQFIQPGICAEASQIFDIEDVVLSQSRIEDSARVPQRRTLRNGGKKWTLKIHMG